MDNIPEPPRFDGSAGDNYITSGYKPSVVNAIRQSEEFHTDLIDVSRLANITKEVGKEIGSDGIEKRLPKALNSVDKMSLASIGCEEERCVIYIWTAYPKNTRHIFNQCTKPEHMGYVGNFPQEGKGAQIVPMMNKRYILMKFIH